MPKREGPKPREIRGGCSVGTFFAAGLRPLGVLCLAWLPEARGLANRNEGLGLPGLVDKGEGFGWVRRAQGPTTKVRAWAKPDPAKPILESSGLPSACGASQEESEEGGDGGLLAEGRAEGTLPFKMFFWGQNNPCKNGTQQ